MTAAGPQELRDGLCEAQGVVAELLDKEFGSRLPMRGGILMPLWVGEYARRAEDLDYLFASEPLQTALGEQIAAALTQPTCPSKGGRVLCVETEVIKQDTPSPGWRFRATVETELGIRKQQVDVAFDDPVAQLPQRVNLSYVGLSGVDVWAYPAESTLAWKIHELFEQPNWRLKHLYDAYVILQHHCVNRGAAAAALRLAFSSRKTSLSRLDRLLSGSFGTSRERPKKWRQFQRRHGYLNTPESHIVLVDSVAAFVGSLRDDLDRESPEFVAHGSW